MKDNKTKKANDIKTFIENNIRIILGVILILIILIGIAFKVKLPISNTKNSKKMQSEKFAHTERGIVKEETFRGVKFSNINLVTDKGYTTFTASVTNISKQDITKDNLNVDLKDKNGDIIITLYIDIPNGLKVNETKQVTSVAKGEFKNVVTKDISA